MKNYIKEFKIQLNNYILSGESPLHAKFLKFNKIKTKYLKIKTYKSIKHQTEIYKTTNSTYKYN